MKTYLSLLFLPAIFAASDSHDEDISAAISVGGLRRLKGGPNGGGGGGGGGGDGGDPPLEASLKITYAPNCTESDLTQCSFHYNDFIKVHSIVTGPLGENDKVDVELNCVAKTEDESGNPIPDTLDEYGNPLHFTTTEVSQRILRCQHRASDLPLGRYAEPHRGQHGMVRAERPQFSPPSLEFAQSTLRTRWRYNLRQWL